MAAGTLFCVAGMWCCSAPCVELSLGSMLGAILGPHETAAGGGPTRATMAAAGVVGVTTASEAATAAGRAAGRVAEAMAGAPDVLSDWEPLGPGVNDTCTATLVHTDWSMPNGAVR